MHASHALQVEIARAAGKNGAEGSWLLQLSQHFVDCHMGPLAAKMLEEALVAFRRDDISVEATRVAVVGIIQMLANMHSCRYCHTPRAMQRSLRSALTFSLLVRMIGKRRCLTTKNCCT